MLAQLSLWMCLALHASGQPMVTPTANLCSGYASANPPLCVSEKTTPPVPLPAQGTFPCLDGVINDYTPVLSFSCDSTTLQVGPLAGFAPGDKVLLLQMQVPQVDLSNTSAFGTLLNSTYIGNYEFNRIKSMGGGSVQLQYALTRNYDTSGKVQLVRVPEYDSATVCSLTCLPWDGSIGGVLALDVKGQLTLSGDIDVSGKGFRGGIVEPNIINWVFGEMQYTYSPQPKLAAAKGEGVVMIPVNYSFGRGRAGNGGGGGNAHNAGGGGGANAGDGGDGGREIVNLPAPPMFNTNGIGGTKYFDFNAYKILLGGGAGAGHANDNRGSSGGHGGGIVLLIANTLHANNFRILSNGVDVFGGTGRNDGQGGGGAGGTVVLKLGQLTGTLPCELKGGRGGSNPYTPDTQLHGPGGGGGGGKLLITQNTPGIIPALQGGINGVSSQNLTNGAAPGASGSILTGFVLPEDTRPTHLVSNRMVLAVQSLPCLGFSSGQIAVLQSTALAFRLNGGPWQTDSIFTGLAPGTYQIGLRFSGSCTLDTTAMLTATPLLRDSLLSSASPSCTSGGSLTVAAVSGTAPFEYQLDNGPWQANGTFNNLAVGNYAITLRDAAGCTHSSPYAVAAPLLVRDSLLSLTNAGCTIGGGITTAAISGIAPFEYQLGSGPWQANGTFGNLPTGQYTITTRDAMGCTHTSTYTVAMKPPAQNSLVALTNAGCSFGGAIATAAVSGTGPFEFQLNGGPWQANGTFNNLSPGNHTITLRDAAGCTHASTYAIAASPPTLDSLVALTNAGCAFGGSIAVVAVAGIQPFEYRLNSGAWQPSGNFNNLPPGNYMVTVRDAAGCIHTSTYAVAAPPPVFDSLVLSVVAGCTFGGSLAVAATAGTSPFDYQLNGGAWQPNGNFNDLLPGNYAVTVRDALGCTHTSTYSVAAPPSVLDSLLSSVSAGCTFGGSLTVTATAGTSPFDYQLDGGAWQANGTFHDLPPGSHTLTLRDAVGCTHTSTYSVAAPPPVQDSLLSSVGAGCTFGGSITTTAVSGTPSFDYQLNGGPWQTNGTFNDLPPGDYSIALRDAVGCTHTSIYSVAAPPPVLDSLLALVNAGCTLNGSLTVVAVSGNPPFDYQLNGGAWQANGAFHDLPPGSYTVMLRDAVGCTHSSTYTIAPPPPASDSLLSITNAGCTFGGSITATAVSGTAPFDYQVNSGAWQNNGTFNDLLPGNYTITLRDAVGCTHTSIYPVYPPKPVVDSLLSSVGAGCTFGGSLTVAAVSGSQPFEYQLNGGAWQTNATFTNLQPGQYALTLRDAAGCTHTSTYAVSAPPPVLDSLLSSVSAGCTFGGSLTVVAVSGTQPFDYQLNGGPWQANGTFSDLTPGQYTVVLRDAAGCTHSNTYSVAAPPNVSDSLVALVGAGCTFGGSLAVTAVSGTQPFDYQLNGGPWQANGHFNDLPPGQYALTLRDAVGCTHSSTYAVAAPPDVSDSLVSLVPAGCTFGGSLAVTAVSGTQPFDYQLNGGPWQTNGTFNDLLVGQYVVTLRDAAGCTHTSTYAVAAPPNVSDSLTALLPAGCTFGGSLAVTAVTGTPPFDYQLNGGPWQTNGTFSDLAPGQYTVTLRDAAGCTYTSTYALAAPPPVLDSLVALLDAGCTFGGSITTVAISGTQPFEYQLNGGLWQANGHFNDLPPGDYTITLRDAAGCTHTSIYPAAAPPPVFDSLLTLVPAGCTFGGSIATVAVAGTQPFEYQLNGGPWQANGVFSDLPPGAYAITLRDAVGCTHTSTYVVAMPPPVLDSLLSLVPAGCTFGGSISTVAVSGTQPFEYQLNGGSWQSKGIFNDLPPGQYTITLRDAAGCIYTSSYTMASPPPALDSLLSLVHTGCTFGGSIVTAAVGGTQPFEYQLNGGTWQSSGIFADLLPGQYAVVLRDAAGCTHTSNYSVAAPSLAQDSLLSLVPAGCSFGGSISTVAVSGLPPFEYQLNNGPWQTSGTFADLLPGLYALTLRDAAGCTDTSHCSVAAPPPTLDSLLSLVNAGCTFGGSLSTIAVSGTQPVEYQLNGGAWQANGTFNDLLPNSYTLTLRDAAGCTHTNAYVVAAPPPALDSLLALADAGCTFGGSIATVAVSGTAPFVYQSNGGPWQANGIFNDLPPGDYTITLRDAMGCTHTSAYSVYPPEPLLDSLVSLASAGCTFGGKIVVAATSGQAPFEFQLNDGVWQTNGVFMDLPPGTYVVASRDADGCTHQSTYVVAAPPPALDLLVRLVGPACDEAGSLSTVAVSGTPPFQFQLGNGPWQPSGVFTDLPSGDYRITLRDAAGCLDSSTYTLVPYEPLVIQVDSLHDVDCRRPLGLVAVTATGGTGPYTYQLGNGPAQSDGYFPDLPADLYTIVVTDSTGCSTEWSNLAVANRIDTALTRETVTIYEGAYVELPDGRRVGRAGQYSFALQTTAGCDSLHLIDLIVLERHVYLPNVFRPNDDGDNDYWTVFSDASLAVVRRLAVYDRWGELIFEKRDLLPNQERGGWDGQFRNTLVNAGVFVWVAELEFVDGWQRTMWGDVTVLR